MSAIYQLFLYLKGIYLLVNASHYMPGQAGWHAPSSNSLSSVRLITKFYKTFFKQANS